MLANLTWSKRIDSDFFSVIGSEMEYLFATFFFCISSAIISLCRLYRVVSLFLSPECFVRVLSYTEKSVLCLSEQGVLLWGLEASR